MSNESFAARADATTVEDLRAIGASKWSDPNVMGAFVAEMDFGVAPAITAALQAEVEEGAFGYTPKKFSTALKEATAARLNRNGWNTKPENVLPIPDVLTGLQIVFEHFSKPGSKVIVTTPAYMPFLMLPPMAGREVIEVPLLQENGTWKYDLDGIQKAFDDGGEIFILCNPYNPIGRVFTEEELVALSEVVERNNGRVFSDEIWAPIVFSESKLVSYATINDVTAGHTITATSASKAWNLPGLKCAELITSNAADQEVIDKVGGFAGHGTATPGMVANTAAFNDGEEWQQECVAYLQGNRDEFASLVAEHLPGVEFIAPEGTYVAWLDFNGVGLEDPATFFAEKAGVGLTDGARCGEVGKGCARFIMATPRPIMREMVQRMGKALAER